MSGSLGVVAEMWGALMFKCPFVLELEFISAYINRSFVKAFNQQI